MSSTTGWAPAEAGASGQPGQSNFVNNFWRAGPGGDNNSGTTITNSAGGTGIFSGGDSTNTKVYHSGNLKDTNKDGDANDGIALTNSDFGSSNFQVAPMWFGGIPTYTGGHRYRHGRLQPSAQLRRRQLEQSQRDRRASFQRNESRHREDPGV
jgi:hypothetical protein